MYIMKFVLALGLGAIFATAPMGVLAQSVASKDKETPSPTPVQGSWARANCAQLQSIGFPNPAWLAPERNSMKSDSLLMLINYQLALALCQNEDTLRTLKAIETQYQKQERLLERIAQNTKTTTTNTGSAPLPLMAPNGSSGGNSSIVAPPSTAPQLQQLIERIRQLSATTSGATSDNMINTNTTNALLTLLSTQGAVNSIPVPATSGTLPMTQSTQPVQTPPQVVQNSQLPDLERLLLRLILTLEEQKNTTLPSPPQPVPISD